jgi:hypothetical protein
MSTYKPDDITPDSFPISGDVCAQLQACVTAAESICQIANASTKAISDDIKLRVLPGSARQFRGELAKLMVLLDQLPDDWDPGYGDTL